MKTRIARKLRRRTDRIAACAAAPGASGRGASRGREQTMPVMRGRPTMTSDQAMRASDHDRERAAEVLRHAYAIGCLDLEEFHDRTDAAYSAKTWGELRDLTADLPAWRIPGRGEHNADSSTPPARPGPAPQRPFAYIWVMAVIWIAIAAAAHTAAAAIPLVLLSLFVLRAARWTVPPEPPPTTQAQLAQPGSLCADQASCGCAMCHGI
jgi:Domain of unknown function (DUF1707)